jgi:tRNA-dihydrouridine synthase
LAFGGDPKRALIEFRKHLAWYTKGLPHGAELREELFGASTMKEIGELLAGYLETGGKVEVERGEPAGVV